MKPITLNSTIAEIMATLPGSVGHFEKMGIDFCCGGNATLEVACRDRGLDPQTVLGLLGEGIPETSREETDLRLASMTPTQLADRIESEYHTRLWAELDRLDATTAKVVEVHGHKDPRLSQLREVFLELAHELAQHMVKEEKILFPLIRQIDAATGPIGSHCGSVANPIRKMDSDHEEATLAFLEMRQLSDDFTPPPGACRTYRAMLTGLEDMERDLREHIREESEYLFPKILKLETEHEMSQMQFTDGGRPLP